MEKIKYSLHSHTYRCGHAKGDIEDFVKEAISKGFNIYGVSDHVFLPGIRQEDKRGEYEYLDDYISKFNESKKLHEKEIELHLGFECEYSGVFEDYYRYLLKEKGIEYLICGQHTRFNDDKSIYNYFSYEDGPIKYKEDVIKAMKSGLFLYIAHPDFIFLHVEEITPIYKQITKEIIEAAIKYDVPLEVNEHGLLRNHFRNGHHYIDYPNDYFWKEVAKTNIKVVTGGDYHSPEALGDSDVVAKERMASFLKRCKIQLTNIKDVYSEYRQRLEKELVHKIKSN